MYKSMSEVKGLWRNVVAGSETGTEDWSSEEVGVRNILMDDGIEE